MATKNEIEVKVRVTDDGLAPLASKIDRVDRATDELGQSATAAGQKLGGIDDAATPALNNVHRGGVNAAGGIDVIASKLQMVQNGLLALTGGASFVHLIQGAAQTADQYHNLAARIKLATGEGELFAQAMEGVERIALATSSSLEGTAHLFTRLTDAGRSAGLGAQEAASQALQLTESINQAMQLSGASAQAGDAALTQLIQGLQSGVLRGEEFNSIMEQAPRLARALSNGLGVTTGELRKMANEGRLTTEVVIGALQSQADTLKSEFETLPPTVGRALQSLSTAWTVYVGETDKATGASRMAATAISALAENLSTIAGYLIDVGQAAAAFAALRLAQMFTGMAVAAAASTAAVASTTVAMTAAGVAGTAASVGVGRFAAALSLLKPLALLGIIVNFQQIGTWIGESVAKLMGYRDVSAEVAKIESERAALAEKQRIAAQAQAASDKAAIESQFELSKAAQSSLAKFDELRQSGKSAAQAVAEIGKDFDLSTSPGIANAAAVFDKLAADGKLSALEFGGAWAAALKGEDLQAFEVKARVALDGAAREGERLAAIIDGTLREAIRRSGADFDVLAGGMGQAARSAVNDVDTIINGMDRLKAQGVDTGQALQASLSTAIKTADSQAAIDALRNRIEQLRGQLSQQVVNGLLAQLESQAAKAAGAVGGLDSALKRLGVTSDAELNRAAANMRGLYEEVVRAGGSAREQSQAFARMAAAAVASGDAGSLAFVRSQAAARGFELSTDAAGKTTVRAMNEAADATSSAGRAADGASGSFRGMARSAAEAAAAAQAVAQINARHASPLGPDIHSRPERRNLTGDTREERLAGQNAVDNSLQFALRDRLNAGGLTVDDLDNLRGVVAALRQREQVDRSVDRMNPAGFSLDGMRDRREWEQVRVRFEQQISRLEAGGGNRAGGPTAASTTHNVNISMGGRTTVVNTASAQDAAALTQFLRGLQDAAGRS